MSVQRIQVFLASRFGEFADLRRVLRERIARIQSPPLEPVDLNDNTADTRPPLARCLDAVDGADVFILLIGETYGERPPNAKLSYTHLEYQKAIEDETKVVLPFFIGTNYEQRLREPDGFPTALRDWQREVRNNHTVAFLDDSKTQEQLAFEVFTSLYSRLWEALSGGADLREDVSDESESSIWEYSPIPLTRLSEPVSSGPLHEIAAAHAREAQRGLELGFRRIALQHLKTAVELVPLHPGWSYWLGRLLVASGRRDACRRGLELARTAAHVSESSPDPRDETASEVQTMAALALAARASERLGDADGALRFANDGYQAADWHWFANLELARQHAQGRRTPEALALVEKAFWQRPDCLNQVVNDDVFVELGAPYKKFLSNLKKQLTTRLGAVCHCRDEATALLQRARQRCNLAIDPAAADPGPTSDRVSILGAVGAIRRNSEFTRTTLQEIAKVIVQTRGSTRARFGSDVGDTTRALLAARVDAIRLRIQTLETQRSRALEAAAKARTLLKGAFWVTAVGGLSTWASCQGLENAPDRTPWLWLLASLALTLAAIGGASQGIEREAEANKRASNLDKQLQEERVSLASETTNLEHHDQWHVALREIVVGFFTVVSTFEELAAERRVFSSAVPRRRAKPGDVVAVRSDGDKLADLGLTLDVALLPADLEELKPVDTPYSPRFVFARLDRSNRLSRAGAYFD